MSRNDKHFNETKYTMVEYIINEETQFVDLIKCHDYYEEVSEAKEEVIRKPKSKPKTNLEEQIQYFEPEEDSVFSNLTDRGGFKEEFVEPSGMPQFGDKDILAKLEKLSAEPVKPVRQRKSSTTPRKPRTPRTKK